MDEQKPKQNQNTLTTILLLLLLASLGGNVFQFFSNREIIIEKEREVVRLDSVTMRKKELEIQFNSALEELNLYQGKNAELDTLLAEATRKLEEQRKQISRLIDQNQDYQVLQQRYAELQKVKDEYLKEIERLTQENKKLKTENTELTVELKQRTEENKDLKGKVDVASKIKLIGMSIKSVSLTNSGKEKETDKAKKTERLSIQVTLEENKLATTGNKTIYVRVISPDGFVLADVSQSVKKFKTERGDEIPYSRAIPINYNGEKFTKLIQWDQETFTPGTYKIEIYIDNYFIGVEKINLY